MAIAPTVLEGTLTTNQTRTGAWKRILVVNYGKVDGGTTHDHFQIKVNDSDPFTVRAGRHYGDVYANGIAKVDLVHLAGTPRFLLLLHD